VPTASELILSLPHRFRPEKAGGFTGTLHFDLAGAGGGQFTVNIRAGACRAEKGHTGEADCIVRAKAPTYADIELGRTNPQMALTLGKVKVSNVPFLMQFTKLFRRFRAEQGRQAKPDESALPSRKPAKGPLKGLRILDLTRLLPGPLATMMLGDQGAEVIKIEDPDAPDYIRDFPPFVAENQSALYLALNRSKRSLTLNLKHPEGRQLFFELVKSADIVMEQYRPAVLDKWGIGYENAKAANERIIYVSITGYGQTGPYAQKAGHDLNYIGYAGILGITGSREGRPVIPGPQLADVAGGAYMAMNACLTALWARQQNGEGQHVDVAMLDGVMPLLSLQAAGYFATGQVPRAGQLPLSGAYANYNVYECADGRWMALGALEPKFWRAFCQAVGKPEWENRILPGTQSPEALKAEVAALFKSKTQPEWTALGEAHDMCLSPILTLDEVEHNAQVKHRQMVLEMAQDGTAFRALGVPLKFSGAEAGPAWAPPRLGEDTHALLKELGRNAAQVAALRERGVV